MTPITIELFLDYGMVSQIWFSDKAKLANFPYKLKKSCELNLFPNKSLYIDTDSISPEWANKNNHSFKRLPSYHFICLYASSINDSVRFYNQIDLTNYNFSVTDIQRCRAHMYNIIQMRFQEDLIPRIIVRTPLMTICLEITQSYLMSRTPIME